MSEEDCTCGEIEPEQSASETPASTGWVDEEPIRHARLPVGVANSMSAFFGESIDTFDDFVSVVRRVGGDGGIAVSELCQTSEETPHYAETAAETYNFLCFYDGVALAHLVEEPAEIHTESPAGTPIEMRASPEEGIQIDQSDAVMSFGVAGGDETRPKEDPTAQDIYSAICPYVKAFPSREEYQDWARDIGPATVGIPLEAGVPIAAALTAESPEKKGA